jgi:hypothetical protein
MPQCPQRVDGVTIAQAASRRSAATSRPPPTSGFGTFRAEGAINMKAILGLVAALAVSQAAWSSDFGPWRFGMSKDEVQSFKDLGPYRSFSNGDLETFDGIFEGRKEDFQFFFDGTGLRRVGVYLYEGTDLDVAMKKWQYAHDVFAKRYGEVEMPGGLPVSSSGMPSREEVQANVRARLASGQKVQMAPVTQPRERFTYSSSWTAVIEGVTHYYVVVNAERPRGSQ